MRGLKGKAVLVNGADSGSGFRLSPAPGSGRRERGRRKGHLNKEAVDKVLAQSDGKGSAFSMALKASS